MLYYTAKFKEDFWVSYQAGNTPRKILEDFGFDLSIFRTKTNMIVTCAAHKKASPGWGGILQKVQIETRRIPPESQQMIEDIGSHLNP